jgi:hypothetical protein
MTRAPDRPPEQKPLTTGMASLHWLKEAVLDCRRAVPRRADEQARPDPEGALSFHTKLSPNHRDTKKMTEILIRQTGILTAY